MKRFNAFASTLRIKTLLCCSAAVLLSACGGNVDPGSEQLSASAASVVTDAGAGIAAHTSAPAAPVETIAEAAPAASNEPAPAPSTEAAPAASPEPAPAASTGGAAPQVADATAQAFELSGYDSSQQAQTEQPDAGANGQAPIQQ